jgi:hypothetical protein
MICLLSDRNSNRIRPGKFVAAGVATQVTLNASANTHTLAGAELTADGVTTHTIGFKVSAGLYTPYFDGVAQVAATALDAGELAILAGTTRMGITYGPADITALTENFISMEWGAAGDIYV